MITELNRNINSWTKVYKIDMVGIHHDQNYEEYFTAQLHIITSQQWDSGYVLRTINGFGNGWILVFTPEVRK